MPRPQMIFDGSDASVAFLDLARNIKISSRAKNSDWADLIPTLLYGDALRYYESLPSDCQDDWLQLRDAMVRRFPGPVLSGGIIARSPTQWEQSGVSTAAQPPPMTASRVLRPPSIVPQDADQGNNNAITKGSYMAGLARSISLLRGSRADPEITIGSFIIELTQGGTVHRPGSAVLQAEVNLNDRMAVLSAREGPLITVNKSAVMLYRVGFTYYVNYGVDFAYYIKHGALSIGAKHKVLLPKQFKSSYKSAMCPAWDTVTPVRNAVQHQSLAEILYHGQPSVTPPHYAKAPIAEYTVQSFFQQSNGKGYENLLDITWIINVA